MPTDPWTVASTLSTAAAAVAAGWAGWSATRATRLTVALVKLEQERSAEEREDRATALAATRRARLLLVARKSSASHESYHLAVSNGGPATATSITIRFFTDETGAVPPFLQRPDTASPFELVHGEVRALGFAANFGCAFSFRCRLEWTDDDGPHMDDRPLELPTA